MKIKYLLTVLIFALTVTGCMPKKRASELFIGKWRGVFNVQGWQTPFNFTVEDDTIGFVKVFLTNGEERFPLDSVRYERDSVIIPIDVYNAVLIAKVEDDSLSGFFRKNLASSRGIPFKAARNQEFRFVRNDTTTNAIAHASGTWSVVLTDDHNKTRYTVGLLKEQGSTVSGTLLSTTGDYRYLDGVVDGDSLKLSAFSGSTPLLLQAKFNDAIHLTGEFLSPAGRTKLQAIRSDTAKLPDPYSLTYLKKGSDEFTFSFPDRTGKLVSLKDEKFKGKVVVVTIMGTWCPNCVDEAAFLSPWYKENQHRGVEIIGLSFERKDDFTFAKARIDKFVKRFDVQYDILFAGISDKAEASKKLPSINAVLSYPTTIIIDRTGKVTKIHTGFSGPATGEYYQEFIKHFNEDVNQALAEEHQKTNL